MSEPARRPATYNDLFELPDNVVGEIVAGELYASPRPANRHSLVSSALGGSLYNPFNFGKGGPGGWWILDEPELHLNGDVMVPDLAGWRKSRMPVVPDTSHFTLAPDWVCEVLSPSTARLDRLVKMPKYAEEKVGHLWLIDPAVRLVEVFELKDAQWVLHGVYGDDQIIQAPPFAVVPLDLLPLWGEVRAEEDKEE